MLEPEDYERMANAVHLAEQALDGAVQKVSNSGFIVVLGVVVLVAAMAIFGLITSFAPTTIAIPTLPEARAQPERPENVPTITPTTIQVKVLLVMVDGVINPDLNTWISLSIKDEFEITGTCGLNGLTFEIPEGTHQATLVRYDTASITRVEILPPTPGNMGTLVVKPLCTLGDKYYFDAH